MPLFGRVAWVLWLFMVGCSEPASSSQAVVCVGADESSLARTSSVSVVVLNQDGEMVLERRATFLDTDPEAVFPLRVPLAPQGGDATRSFEVVIELLDQGGDAISRQRLQGGFAADSLLAYEVDFRGACIDQLGCPADETCRGGTCVPALAEGTRVQEPWTLDRSCPVSVTGSRQGYSERAQGHQGWYYGYYDRVADADESYDPSDDFVFLVADGGGWRVAGEPPDPWRTAIWETGVQPLTLGSGDGGPLWHVPIRRFVAPADGRYELEVTFRNQDPRNPDVEPDADGIEALVWIEGEMRGNDFIEPDDGSDHLVTIDTELRRGDRVDFGLDSGDSSVFDPTHYVVDIAGP